MELATLRVLVAAARCPTVAIRGEGLGQVLKTCYNIYLSSSSGANQLCAKLALAQVLVIVFARVKVDSMDVRVQTVSIMDMLDMSDRSLNDSSIVQMAQGFINEAMEGNDVPEPGTPLAQAEVDGEEEAGMSKVREDGLTLFKNLCRLSMKFSTPDNPEDQMLLRGKMLSLELLKMVVDNAGPFWRTNEKYDLIPAIIFLLYVFQFF
jgi:brefeldin A-inhibited guanine nucleotide-exchange protein